jgi:hypothetical protein
MVAAGLAIMHFTNAGAFVVWSIMPADLYIAIASFAFTIIVGVVMAIHPEWRVFGWVLIAISVGVLFWSTAAFLVPKTAASLILKGFPFALGAMGVCMAACIALAVERPSSIPKTDEGASLRLQFYGDDRWPTQMTATNVTDWFTFRSAQGRVVTRDESGKEHEILAVPETWAVMIVFNKQTTYREVSVGFNAPGLPNYNVFQKTQRSIVVAFNGHIPAGQLEITTIGNSKPL